MNYNFELEKEKFHKAIDEYLSDDEELMICNDYFYIFMIRKNENRYMLCSYSSVSGVHPFRMFGCKIKALNAFNALCE